MTIILATIDASPAAQPVLQSASTLAATLGLHVVALHVPRDGAEPAHLLAAARPSPSAKPSPRWPPTVSS